MNDAMPPMAIPVLRTPWLARLTAFYREAIGFDVVQQVPGVVSLLRHGDLQLQLWQYAPGGGPCRIALNGDGACIFQLHKRLARRARPLLDGAAPQLKPWGAWEFRLIDIDGNQLVFVQWVRGRVLPGPAAGEAGLPWRPQA